MDSEKEEILRSITAFFDHFDQYINRCNESWPRCWKCKKEMCQVIMKGKNIFYQCFETPNGRLCGHKEYNI